MAFRTYCPHADPEVQQPKIPPPAGIGRRPEDPRYAIAKFGKVREDGTLEVPNPYTLKWVLPYYCRMTEKQVVYSMYALTLAFCGIGLFVPG